MTTRGMALRTSIQGRCCRPVGLHAEQQESRCTIYLPSDITGIPDACSEGAQPPEPRIKLMKGERARKKGNKEEGRKRVRKPSKKEM